MVIQNDETGSREQEMIERCSEAISGWERADELTRSYELEAVGRELGRTFEAPAPPVSIERFEDPRLLGRYDDETFRLELNEQLLEEPEPDEALDTYLHEYRHAAQAYEVQKSHGVLSHEVDAQEAAEMERALAEYVSPEEDPQCYWEQVAERDAREFSADITDRVLAETTRRNKRDA